MSKGLGRIAVADSRDEKFLIKSVLPKKITITKRYWYDNGWWGDQKNTSECVGYSLAHWLEDGPVTQPGAAPILKPNFIYKEAQKVDEWEGTSYDGTSVRAGAKILFQHGFISSYRWAWDVDTLVDAILSLGPVVVGTNWYEKMFYPENNIISVGGKIAGGHAYVVNGVNTVTEMFRIKNSWGRTWGNNGRAFISFKDMERLINEWGEVLLAVEEKSRS